MDTIKKGTIVQLWCDAANYGIVTRINKKSFRVLHNGGGDTLYYFANREYRDYMCKSNCFRCSIVRVDGGLLHAVKQLHESCIFNRLDADIQLMLNNLKLELTPENNPV